MTAWEQPDMAGFEALLADLVDPAVEPRPGECLAHYLDRMLSATGCRNDHRFLRRWAQRRARPNVPSLLAWAFDTGGCCCDCEVMLNSLGKRSARKRAGVLCSAATSWLDDCDDTPAGPCAGVHGSAPPNGVWDLNPYDGTVEDGT